MAETQSMSNGQKLSSTQLEDLPENKKAARELRILDILEKMNPEDLTDHPNFPEYVDGITHEVYAEKIESYWINRRNRQLKKALPDPEQISNLSQSKTQKEYPDYPVRTAEMTKEDHQEELKKFFKLKGLRHGSDFSDDEKNAVIEECTVHLIGPTELSKKYNTLVTVISTIVRDAKLSVTPDDMSKHPDFPKKYENMTQDEYQLVIKKYWKNKKSKRDFERKQTKRLQAEIAARKKISPLLGNFYFTTPAKPFVGNWD